MQCVKILFVLLTVLIVTSTAVDIQCKPAKRQQEQCSITKLNGDYTNQTVHIRIQSAKKTTNVTIEEVKLGQLPITFFRTFKQLEYLTINKCGLTTLQGFRQSKTLRQLYLNRNKLTEIGPGQLSPTIVFLEARNNSIRRIHKNAFAKLHNLYWLDLANNRIRRIKRKMIVPSLTSLNLENNFLRKIDGVFIKHPQLKYLNLGKNRIGPIISNKTFASLKQLKELDLSNNWIEIIESGAFRDSQHLRLLKLNNNRMTSFSLEITSLALSLIYIQQNNLTSISITSTQPLNTLADLKVVAYKNKLSNIRFSTGLPITALALDKNQITDIEFVTKLRKLEQLSLSGNNLTSANFSHLHSTTINRLDLENTQLRPAQFKVVLALRHLILMLNVSKNKQLAGFNFAKNSCPVASLHLNGCGLQAINITELKKTFRNLRELQVSDNLFNCSQLREEQGKIRESKLILKCNDMILKR